MVIFTVEESGSCGDGTVVESGSCGHGHCGRDRKLWS